jgi:hypothetical protein
MAWQDEKKMTRHITWSFAWVLLSAPFLSVCYDEGVILQCFMMREWHCSAIWWGSDTALLYDEGVTLQCYMMREWHCSAIWWGSDIALLYDEGVILQPYLMKRVVFTARVICFPTSEDQVTLQRKRCITGRAKLISIT